MIASRGGTQLRSSIAPLSSGAAYVLILLMCLVHHGVDTDSYGTSGDEVMGREMTWSHATGCYHGNPLNTPHMKTPKVQWFGTKVQSTLYFKLA